MAGTTFPSAYESSVYELRLPEALIPILRADSRLSVHTASDSTVSDLPGPGRTLDQFLSYLGRGLEVGIEKFNSRLDRRRGSRVDARPRKQNTLCEDGDRGSLMGPRTSYRGRRISQPEILVPDNWVFLDPSHQHLFTKLAPISKEQVLVVAYNRRDSIGSRETRRDSHVSSISTDKIIPIIPS